MSQMWYAAAVKPLADRMPIKFRAACWHDCSWALLNLRQQGFETYCPLRRHRTVLRDRRFELMQPMFGRYVFLMVDLLDWGWHRVNNTSGVIHLLPTHLEEPLALPEQFVPELQAREAEAEAVRAAAAEELMSRFKAHDVVRILRGRLARQTAEVIISAGARRGLRSRCLPVKPFSRCRPMISRRSSPMAHEPQ